MQELKVTSKHVPGRVNVVADALSRRPDLHAATAAFEFGARTHTGHLVERRQPVSSELPPRRHSQVDNIMIAECAPPALQVETSSQCTPAAAVREAVAGATAEVSATGAGAREDTCEQKALLPQMPLRVCGSAAAF